MKNFIGWFSMLKWYNILPLFAVVFVASCSVAEPVFIAHKDLKLGKVNDSVLEFTITTEIYNPTGFTYQLRELDFDIGHGTENLGHATLTETKNVVKKDTIALPLSGKLYLAQLQKVHQEVLAKDTIALHFEGEGYAVHPLKKIRKGFQLKMPYAIENIIARTMAGNRLSLARVALKRPDLFDLTNLAQSKFQAFLNIGNGQPFDFDIKKIDLTITSKTSGSTLFTCRLDSVVTVPQQQIVQLPLEVKSHNLNLLQNFKSFLFGQPPTENVGSGTINIALKGHEFQIPIHREFNMDLNRLGSTLPAREKRIQQNKNSMNAQQSISRYGNL